MTESPFRPLERITLIGDQEPATDLGTPPDLVWLQLSSLVIDRRYQRDIGERGRRNIRNIIENFDWSRFTPVVVAKLEDGRFAIVDGQHRATAAFSHGQIDRVPCEVIGADGKMQARAFIHINGSVTKISPMQLYHAGIAAGDPDCLMVEQVAAATGVTILKYPKQEQDRKPGETMCASLIGRLVAAHGARAVRLALAGLREADYGGMITANLIRGAVSALVERPGLAADEPRYLYAMGRIHHDDLLRKAEVARLNDRRPLWTLYREALTAALLECMEIERPERRKIGSTGHVSAQAQA